MKKDSKIYFIILLLAAISLAVVGVLFFFSREKPEIKPERNFTIIVVPDTQKYLLDGKYSEIFEAQVEWIAENKDLMNIKFVIHEGDIVENWDDRKEWEEAKTIMEILEKNKIPFSVIPGNHDHEDNDTNGSSVFYNEYFSVSSFSEKDWWGGNYNQNDNNYQLLKIQGIDFIFLGLDWCPSDDEIEWADSILKSYPQRKAILTTHGYLDDATATRKGIHGCNDTNYIWNDLVKKHKNLQIVLSGHEHDDDGEAFRTDINLSGKRVYQMMADYQGEPAGGNGWLRILEFSPSEDKIYVKTYSPHSSRYEKDKNSQFILDYEF